jgi:hypothetical protein
LQVQPAASTGVAFLGDATIDEAVNRGKSGEPSFQFPWNQQAAGLGFLISGQGAIVAACCPGSSDGIVQLPGGILAAYRGA